MSLFSAYLIPSHSSYPHSIVSYSKKPFFIPITRLNFLKCIHGKNCTKYDELCNNLINIFISQEALISLKSGIRAHHRSSP